MTDFSIRPATVADGPILWQALFEAAHLREEGHTDIQAVKERPDLAHYIRGWMLPGDLGVVAVDGAGNPVGATWLRLLTHEDPGYGYVDDQTPELAIGIVPSYRGLGVGKAMITALVELAKPHYTQISLSTRATNLPAVRLYEGVGFQKIAGTEVVNWTGGVSYNMKLTIDNGR